MNALDAELALDRLEARLASELPAHIAACAHAYADGTSAPSAIEITHRDVAAVLAARSIDGLRARGTRLLRVIAPIVIESAPHVIAARALERTWENWRALAVVREREARARFGLSHRVLVHALAGVSEAETSATSNARARADASADTGAPATNLSAGRIELHNEGDGPLRGEHVSGWRTRDARDKGSLPDHSIHSVWAFLCGGESFGGLSIVRSESAHARTFVVERGGGAIIIVPERIDTPAARFAVLHELGHALLWLSPISREHEWPRAIDEAAACCVARVMERDGAEVDRVPDGAIADWYSPLARFARDRRLAIAHLLDAIESGAASDDVERPPWALWNDPHAQAAYIEAERIADDMPPRLRGNAVAEYLASRASAIDVRGW